MEIFFFISSFNKNGKSFYGLLSLLYKVIRRFLFSNLAPLKIGYTNHPPPNNELQLITSRNIIFFSIQYYLSDYSPGYRENCRDVKF